MTPRPAQGAQHRALASAFLARFFDNDVTGGSNDLKGTFFWLVGFLAAPGFMIAIMMMVQWDSIARFRGVEALRDSAMSSKLLYLSFSMTASGLLAAMTWNSLLLDQRDALVLGILPVRPRVVIASKLVALGGYLGLLALAMHGPAAVSFGIVLASQNTFAFLVRGILAHLMAAALSSAFIFLAVTAAQGLALALVGPRLFKRVSSILQVALIACVLIGLTLGPYLAIATRDTLRGSGYYNHPWILRTPPFWFLGSYEWILGTSKPLLAALHAQALTALVIAALGTVAGYLVTYARVAHTAVEGGEGVAPRRRAAALADRIVVRLVRRPRAQAAAQFFVSSLARVERLRFVMAIAIGIVVGWSGPVLLLWSAYGTPAQPPQSVLALSLADVAFLLAGLRIAAAMPSDLKAAWIVPAIGAPGTELRSGLWRVLFLAGTVPVMILALPLHVWLWGAASALAHAVTLAAAGALLTELLLWNFERMPSATPWRPEQAEFGKRWPLYGIAFLAFSGGFAGLEALTVDRPLLFVVFIGGLVALTFGVRLAHHRRRRVAWDAPDVDDLAAPAVLNIS